MPESEKTLPQWHKLLRITSVVLENLRRTEETLPLDVHMALLFIAVLCSDKQGRLLSKKEACKVVGVEDRRTIGRYFVQAEEEGWIEFVTLPSDRRKHFIRPTQKLEQWIEQKMTRISLDLERMEIKI